jgi:hypothetical protein
LAQLLASRKIVFRKKFSRSRPSPTILAFAIFF